MLSKSKIKFIRSLEQKKFRNELNLFVAEGNKIVDELIKQKWPIEELYATSSWEGINYYSKSNIISETELEKISFQKTPQQVLAICRLKENEIDFNILNHSLCLGLDDVQDPGNVGTIIRIADWFGIKHIFSGKGTAELYNPKVIQSTMGAFTRVTVHDVDLISFLKEYKTRTKLPIFGTLLDGNNFYKEKFTPEGIIIMGSEGKGISKEIRSQLTHKFFIPSFPEGSQTSESLNVATATAIICSEFRRLLNTSL